MLTKIVVEKTYWIGMTKEQSQLLLSAVIRIVGNVEMLTVSNVSDDQLEVLNDLRETLLSA